MSGSGHAGAGGAVAAGAEEVAAAVFVPRAADARAALADRAVAVERAAHPVGAAGAAAVDRVADVAIRVAGALTVVLTGYAAPVNAHRQGGGAVGVLHARDRIIWVADDADAGRAAVSEFAVGVRAAAAALQPGVIADRGDATAAFVVVGVARTATAVPRTKAAAGQGEGATESVVTARDAGILLATWRRAARVATGVARWVADHATALTADRRGVGALVAANAMTTRTLRADIVVAVIAFTGLRASIATDRRFTRARLVGWAFRGTSRQEGGEPPSSTAI